MTRALWLALKLALLVALAVWVANRPGEVTVEWLGWRLEDAPIGVLLLALILLCAVVAVAYHAWRWLRGTPAGLGRRMAESKRQRGYRALSQGMAAVAAGDAGEAARWAKRADELLAEPPLTRLLQAQAAQLNGDETAARRYFEAMVENPETRFIGLRGLITQALKENDQARALDLLRRARQLRPKTPWVLTQLVDLAERQGELALAEDALEAAGRVKALPPPETAARRAALALERARRAAEADDPEQALKQAKRAHKAAGDWLPASLMLAGFLQQAGRVRECRRVIEETWAKNPHPQLAELYRLTVTSKDPVTVLRDLAPLTRRNADHPESHLTLAQAALTAQLWGETRRHLSALEDGALSQRACRLWAAVEEGEHGDGEKARHWLGRAHAALPDPLWLCDTCGTQAGEWRAPHWPSHCSHCGSFASLSWQPPRRAVPAPSPISESGENESPKLLTGA